MARAGRIDVLRQADHRTLRRRAGVGRRAGAAPRLPRAL